MAVEYAGLKANVAGKGWSALGLWRASVVAVMTLVTVPVQSIVLVALPRYWWVMPTLWHRTACRLIGIRVERLAPRRHGKPVLYVANHISWLDILVLGGVLPKASFVAKAEVQTWGVFGWLAGLHRTLYVDRARRTASAAQRDSLAERVQEGSSLILFPEGTSTDGMKVLKFKSSLFSVAERADEAAHHDLIIQPITIAYTEVNGMPLTRALKPIVAWLGDAELVGHLKSLIGVGRVAATVEFHEPVTYTEMGCRKVLAAHCETAIRAGLERAHRHEARFGPQRVPELVAPEAVDASFEDGGLPA
ncbi:lysophospholipid acyltransferase family protein [Pseudokordiimonas caeni]|uniref:lysophospholipid acyltransferase family protein n=1 Tax=Pseudokordiimonas caeni TaxID=2997908 RepID=UPI0028118C51|nr:lysophospholipid acyltransferase family protein [Pseudokordiimonas caeni]